jgi:ethanolamine utilization cobalamin adenosyltransferase
MTEDDTGEFLNRQLLDLFYHTETGLFFTKKGQGKTRKSKLKASKQKSKSKSNETIEKFLQVPDEKDVYEKLVFKQRMLIMMSI